MTMITLFETPAGHQVPTGNQQGNQAKGTLSGDHETPNTLHSMGKSVANMGTYLVPR